MLLYKAIVSNPVFFVSLKTKWKNVFVWGFRRLMTTIKKTKANWLSYKQFFFHFSCLYYWIFLLPVLFFFLSLILLFFYSFVFLVVEKVLEERVSFILFAVKPISAFWDGKWSKQNTRNIKKVHRCDPGKMNGQIKYPLRLFTSLIQPFKLLQ